MLPAKRRIEEAEMRLEQVRGLRDTLEEIEQIASFDRGHPTFDKIAAKARAALERFH